MLISSTESLAEENVFIIENVNVEGPLDLNFSRDKYLNKAFMNSFNILMSKVLLSKDFNKITNIKLKEIKKLINSFQILDEKYQADKYKINLKIFFNEVKVKKYLEKNNISFSQPTNIDAIFFPVLFENEEMKDFNDNFFYKQWISVEIKNELINFYTSLRRFR